MRLASGNVAVANAARHEIRVFDRRGRLAVSFGRRGNGPGEFQELYKLFRIAGDSLLVVHSPGPPVVATLLFTPSGRFVRGARPTDGGALGNLVATFNDGSYLAWRFERTPANAAGTRLDSIPLTRTDADWKTPSPLGKFAYRVTTGTISRSSIAFSPNAFVAAAPNGFYYGFADRQEHRLYSVTGALRRIVRRADETKPTSRRSPR